jgi:hypothetical protein
MQIRHQLDQETDPPLGTDAGVLVATDFPFLCFVAPEPAPNNHPILPNTLIRLLTIAGTADASTSWLFVVAVGSVSGADDGVTYGRSESALVMARRASCIVSSSRGVSLFVKDGENTYFDEEARYWYEGKRF